jgi:hypothetical protein
MVTIQTNDMRETAIEKNFVWWQGFEIYIFVKSHSVEHRN